ncbi:MAG: protein-export chaperone SecB [Thermodesulfobacteriota bacterium]
MAENNEETPQAGTEQPVFKMQKMFIKDLSFENPNAPAVFLENSQSPKVDIQLHVKNNKLDDENWEVSLSITASFTGAEEKTIFIIEIEHAGVFLLKNIPAEHMAAVLAVDCPTMLFPFTRQIMSQLAVDGGFMPFLMDPVNFMGLFQNAQQKNQPEQGVAQ